MIKSGYMDNVDETLSWKHRYITRKVSSFFLNLSIGDLSLKRKKKKRKNNR